MKTLFKVIKELRCSNYYIIKQRPFRMSLFLSTGRCSPFSYSLRMRGPGVHVDSRFRREYDEGGNGQARAGGGSSGPARRILCACTARKSTWRRACAETTTGGGKQPGPGGGEEHRPIPGRACAENTTGRGEDDVMPINLRERVEFSEAKRKLIETFLKS